MNEYEPKPIFSGTESSRAADCVQGQLNVLRAGLLLLTALFALYVWVQVHYLGIERKNLQPFLQGYEKEKQTVVEPLLAKISEYGRTHPAFAPIMQKYGIPPATNAPATAKPAAPAPAPAKPAPAPKK
jgi:hypothetical protein